MWVTLKPMLYDSTMNKQGSHVHGELGSRVDEEVEGVAVRGEVVVDNGVVKLSLGVELLE